MSGKRYFQIIEEAGPRVLETPQGVLGVAKLHDSPRPRPAGLGDHGQQRLADEPGAVVVREDLLVEVDHLRSSKWP
jgi:hypothetical protein